MLLPAKMIVPANRRPSLTRPKLRRSVPVRDLFVPCMGRAGGASYPGPERADSAAAAQAQYQRRRVGCAREQDCCECEGARLPSAFRLSAFRPSSAPAATRQRPPGDEIRDAWPARTVCACPSGLTSLDSGLRATESDE
jgi:hypothetical protein